MKILYEGKDIFNDVSLSQCWHDMYAERKSDCLIIKFNDAKKLWDSWGAKTGDKIQVVSGASDTGIMFIDSVVPSYGMITLTAYSYPPTVKDKRSKSWNEIKFSALADYVANNNGLKLKKFDVEDFTYKYVAQKNISDFEFLQQRAVLEGCAFLVYNEELILYKEEKLESKGSQGTIDIENAPKTYRPENQINFTYDSNRLNSFESVEITNGVETGLYSCGNGTGKELKKVLPLPMTDTGEAERFAKNLLRFYNKNQDLGSVSMKFCDKYSPGSIITIKNKNNPSWNGDFFVTHVRQDYTNGRTKIDFRKKLEGY